MLCVILMLEIVSDSLSLIKPNYECVGGGNTGGPAGLALWICSLIEVCQSHTDGVTLGACHTSIAATSYPCSLIYTPCYQQTLWFQGQ